MAERAEIPVAPRVGESGVAAEDADRAVAVAPPDIFHVRVENAVAELADELDVIDALIAQVRGVVVEAKALVILHRFHARVGGGDVEGDFGRDALPARS